MRTISKVGLACIQGEKLMVLRKRGVDLLILPGGKPESGEDAEATLAREVAEETLSELRVGELRFFGTVEDVAADDPSALVRVSVYLGQITGTCTAASEIEEIRWFDPRCDDANILAPSIRNHVLPTLQAQGLLPMPDRWPCQQRTE